jgi:hypothetical protein
MPQATPRLLTQLDASFTAEDAEFAEVGPLFSSAHFRALCGKGSEASTKMPKPKRDPLNELLKYAIVSAGMLLAMLVLTRGKWLTALLLGVWLGFVWLRFKRKT